MLILICSSQAEKLEIQANAAIYDKRAKFGTEIENQQLNYFWRGPTRGLSQFS